MSNLVQNIERQNPLSPIHSSEETLHHEIAAYVQVQTTMEKLLAEIEHLKRKFEENQIEDELLDLDQVARITKMSKSKLYKRQEEDCCPPMFKLNGKLVAKRSEVEAWIKSLNQKSSFVDSTIY
jgi:predicted DNA-binding transcriptional regulator AlpA